MLGAARSCLARKRIFTDEAVHQQQGKYLFVEFRWLLAQLFELGARGIDDFGRYVVILVGQDDVERDHRFQQLAVHLQQGLERNLLFIGITDRLRYAAQLIVEQVDGSCFNIVNRGDVDVRRGRLAIPDDETAGFDVEPAPKQVERHLVCALREFVFPRERCLAGRVDASREFGFTF